MKFVAGLVSVVLAFVLGIVLLGSDEAESQGLSGIEGLDASKIPGGWAPWVVKAGSLCPEFAPSMIAAQIEAESGWNPRAVSSVGAQGLSQFMPATWAAFGRDDDGNGVASPFDPGDAIMAQGRYDCHLVNQLRGKIPGDLTRLALAAYNAGPGAVMKYKGIPPFAETTKYVTKILELASKYSAPATSTTTSGAAGAVIAIALSKRGTPYAYGGGDKYGPGPGWNPGPAGWDCSSFMQYVFWQGARLDLPRTSGEQGKTGTAVAKEAIQPGDIIAFPGHVGLYIGGGQMIHEPHTGDVAKVEKIIGSKHWEAKPWNIRRVL